VRTTRFFAALLALGLMGMADPPRGDHGLIVQGLSADSRAERLAALKRAEKIGDLPEPLVAPVLACVKRELEAATRASALADGASGGPLPGSPLCGDEASLARLKDKPPEFIDRPFVLCGRVRASNRFEFGYGNAARTHYAFRFQPVTASGDVFPEDSASVYVSRRIGRGLADDVARVEAKTPDTPLLVRLTCTVHRNRLENGPANILGTVEATDWQYYDVESKAWAPPAFEGMKRGMAAVKTADRNAVAGLVDVVASGAESPDTAVDDVFRGSAFLTLLSLSEAARTDAVERLRQALPAAKRDRPRRWITEVGSALERTVDKKRVAEKPGAKNGESPARAASALRIGANLEKSGKTAAAVKQYRQVIADFPGTPSAKTAAERIRSIAEESDPALIRP